MSSWPPQLKDSNDARFSPGMGTAREAGSAMINSQVSMWGMKTAGTQYKPSMPFDRRPAIQLIDECDVAKVEIDRLGGIR